ncbi:MAG: hypothetical protein BroJett010_12410 [Gammaproteobacteria bacterium]|nr:hypothetical protein [Gammaproteobacteria bacterium]QOJ32172.1 MAG: hypothetical protein HRU81_08710 [Gammaproteobacteria bacterium]GIK34682.1 MAG: hypothetical protein BroJett010_12410 [Gammaproteobacteria bacterium]
MKPAELTRLQYIGEIVVLISVWSNRRTITAVTLLFSLITASGVRASGHCDYKQFSPRLNRWFPMCQMPASNGTCETLAVSKGISEVKYAEGACATQGVVGECTTGDKQRFFYSGKSSSLSTGCQRLGGVWNTNQKPQTSSP